VLPIDPESGGTWIAANDAGLILTVLNVNAGAAPVRRMDAVRSRGLIIPMLLGCASLGEAVERAADLNATDYAPFRLVLVERDEWAELRSDGRRVQVLHRAGLTEPLLFTSSGLGDALVEAPRRQLFRELFARPSDPAALQNVFHWHRWLDRPHLSVNMKRADACTVSRTVVALGEDDVSMTYHSADARPRTVALELLSEVLR
jgi:hypothetical protein